MNDLIPAFVAYVSCPLFVPATKLDWKGKAEASGADALVIDLEDAVPVQDKNKARANLPQWLAETTLPTIVRLNAAGSQEFQRDVNALQDSRPFAVMLPKVSSSEDLKRVSALLPDVSLIPIIESAQGLENVNGIAGGYNVLRLAFGSLDLAADLGMRMSTPTYDPLQSARFQLTMASRLADVQPPLDGVVADFRDESLLRIEAARARSLGFGGKLCIHPLQVPVVVRSFGATEEELRFAARVVAAADATLGGAFELDGRMVDAPIVAMARAVLARGKRFSA